MNNKLIENNNSHKPHTLWEIYTTGDRIPCEEYCLPLNLIVLKEEILKEESSTHISEDDSVVFVIRESILTSSIGFKYLSDEIFCDSFVCDIEGNLLKIHNTNALSEYITYKNKLLATLSNVLNSGDGFLSSKKYDSIVLANADFLSKWRATSIHLKNGSAIYDTLLIDVKDKSVRGARANSITKF